MVHNVYFWLKEGSPTGERQKLAESCLQLLGKIPTVRHLWAGSPAGTPRRDVIDATYDVGLTVILADLPAHDLYQAHPLHKEFIARHKENWKRVQVYDFE